MLAVAHKKHQILEWSQSWIREEKWVENGVFGIPNRTPRSFISFRDFMGLSLFIGGCNMKDRAPSLYPCTNSCSSLARSDAKVGRTIGIAINRHNGILNHEELFGWNLKLVIVAIELTFCLVRISSSLPRKWASSPRDSSSSSCSSSRISISGSFPSNTCVEDGEHIACTYQRVNTL